MRATYVPSTERYSASGNDDRRQSHTWETGRAEDAGNSQPLGSTAKSAGVPLRRPHRAYRYTGRDIHLPCQTRSPAGRYAPLLLAGKAIAHLSHARTCDLMPSIMTQVVMWLDLCSRGPAALNNLLKMQGIFGPMMRRLRRHIRRHGLGPDTPQTGGAAARIP